MGLKKALSLCAVICFSVILVTHQKEVRAKTSNPLDPSESIRLKKKSAKVDGFRTARFGMTEKEVLKSIFKDFTIPKSKIKRRVHPKEKTVSFIFQVKNLLPGSGLAKLFYVFGFKTKRLIQINILWDRTATLEFNPQKVVDTANQLRNHFLSQGFQKEGLVVNAKLSDGSMLVFRGVDAQGRMVVLLLVNPPSKEGQSSNQNVNLRLAYIETPDSPDIYKIKKEDF